MEAVSRKITGGLLLLFGLFLTFVNFFDFFMFFLGIITLVLGVYIFFNKKEDEIEEIRLEKKLKGGKKK